MTGQLESRLDLLYLLERLEELFASAAHLPLTSRSLVDEHEALDIIDQMRLSLPRELEQARQTIAAHDEILAQANEQAEGLLAQAEEEALRRTQEHEVIASARLEADKLLESATREAELLRREADDYAYNVLASLANRVERIQSTVRDGLDSLAATEPHDDHERRRG